MPQSDDCKNKNSNLFRKKLWFRIEETFSKGTISIIIWLAIFTLLFSVFFGIAILIFGKNTGDSQNNNIIESIWQSFLHLIDTGTISTDQNWSFRIIAFFSTIVGILIFGSLIGVLTTGVNQIFINIRKGKSEIIINNFTLIIGWSPTIFKIISELVLANSNHKNQYIVILAQEDKIEMEDQIHQTLNQKEILKRADLKSSTKKFKKNHKTKIYVRNGNPIDLNSLKMVHPKHAKSIIILPKCEENPDISIIKIILALDSLNVSKPVVTEIRNEHNIKSMNYCLHGFNNTNKMYIPSKNWLSKVTAQTSLQSGYSIILSELLNYEANEIYLSSVPEYLIGKNFETALVSCKSSIVIGIKKEILDVNGFKDSIVCKQIRENIIINPLIKCKEESTNLVFEKNDKIIHIQFDDDSPTFIPERFSFKPIHKQNLIKEDIITSSKILILGFNSRVYTIIEEIYEYIDNSSEIIIIADISNKSEIENQFNNNIKFKDLNIKLINGDTTDFEILEEFNIQSFTSIIILGYDNLSVHEKDAKSILTILHIRQLLQGRDENIVAEIYDEKNRAIVELSKACDYIISDNIVSSMMTQLSEEKDLYWVFDELFDDTGSEIYLKNISEYLNDFEKEYDFFELIELASQKKQIAIGFREMIFSEIQAKNYGVVINPLKETKRIYTKNDKLIIIK